MKNIVFLLLCFSTTLIAQQEIPPTEVGNLKGAGYKILFPENWSGNLIMFAHGYEFVGSPGVQSQEAAWETAMKPYLERGFAVAASDYRQKGFVLPLAVDDTEALRKHFIKKYKTPDTTFIVGVSMGGGIALATIENLSKPYQGALALCPLSSRPYLQVRKEFDMYATFQAFFPGIVPKLSEIFDIDHTKSRPALNEMMASVKKIKADIVAKDSLMGVAFAKRFDLRFDDLPFALFFNENVLRDIAQKAQGNPFDNTNTVYSGFPDDFKVNQHAERLAATADPNTIFSTYDRTGNIDKPVVLMHTLYDQLIPPTYGVTNFENMVQQKGKAAFLTVKYTTGQGHCRFTPDQIGKAFDALRHWVRTGQKAEPGFIE